MLQHLHRVLRGLLEVMRKLGMRGSAPLNASLSSGTLQHARGPYPPPP